MILKVIKRDGRIVDFDQERIINAIFKAARAVGGENRRLAAELSNQVVDILKDKYPDGIPPVEDIQDIVEKVLIENGHAKTAKAYILYRRQHEQMRNFQAIMVDAEKMVQEYVNDEDWKVKENSNMNYSLQGLNNHIISAVTSKYWLEKIYSEEIRGLHKDGDLHIHDLSLLAPYCCGWDISDVLLNGFAGVSEKVESAPPKHFRTALGQIVNFFYTLQGEAAGAQAFANFDTYLAPFIRYDGLDYREVKQAIQEFIFNINVPTRVGFQTPFVNITMDIVVPENLGNENIIISGKHQDETYQEFQDEMDMMNLAFCDVMMEGDAKGRIFSFPIPTYNVSNNFDWDSPVVEKIMEMTAKYGIPYFANFINSDMSPDDVRSMCPVDGKEKVLICMENGQVKYENIENVYESTSRGKACCQVYSHGNFVKGRFNKYERVDMISVILENGHRVNMTSEHLNYVLKKENMEVEVVKGRQLKVGDYLPYSLKPFNGYGGNKGLGFLVGAFGGQGSFINNETIEISVKSSERKELSERIARIAREHFNVDCIQKTSNCDGTTGTIQINSKKATRYCMDFVGGDDYSTKYYKPKMYMMSKDFRLGVIEGHSVSGGQAPGHVYACSEKMTETLNMLAATYGVVTTVKHMDSDDINSNYIKNIELHGLDEKSFPAQWPIKDDKVWVKIQSIDNTNEKTAYCLEVADDEPIFTLGSTGVLTHNCRLRLDNRELIKRGGGLFGANPLTGSIGVVTLNMPRIGYISSTKEEFFERVRYLMNVAKESLLVKRKNLEKMTVIGLYPYSKFYLRQVYERFGEYWKNHFNTIGLVGMNEAVRNFLGESIAEKRGYAFSLEVLDFMRDVLVEFQTESGDLFNLEATPAEGVSYRLPSIDRAKYPDIITSGDEEPYYTNSTQLPVNYTEDVFEALDLQDELQARYTGGTVFHGFVGERIEDITACKHLLKSVLSTYSIPYFTITPTFSVCSSHGYLRGEHKSCPECGGSVEVWSRVVGFYRPIKNWNKGKQREFEERTEFVV